MYSDASIQTGVDYYRYFPEIFIKTKALAAKSVNGMETVHFSDLHNCAIRLARCGVPHLQRKEVLNPPRPSVPSRGRIEQKITEQRLLGLNIHNFYASGNISCMGWRTNIFRSGFHLFDFLLALASRIRPSFGWQCG